MSQFLIRQAAKIIAGSAAPQLASQLTSQLTERLAAPSVDPQERRRFLIWVSGEFKQAHPDAYQRLWRRLSGDDRAINALTGVFLELQQAEDGGPQAAADWFAELAASEQRHYEELLAALAPQPDPKQLAQQAGKQAETSLRGAARFLGRTYRRANTRKD